MLVRMTTSKEQARRDYSPREGDWIRFVYREPDQTGLFEKGIVEDEDWRDENGQLETVGGHEDLSGDGVEIVRYAACTHFCARCGPLPAGKSAGPKR